MRVTILNYTSWPSLNIGLASLIASVRQEGHDVSLIDLAFLPRAEILEHVTREVGKDSPDVIGISTQFDSEELSAMIAIIRQELGDIPILIGGILPTSSLLMYGQEQLTPSGRIWTFTGEANTAVCRFLQNFRRGVLPRKTSIAGMPENLDTLPIPDFTLFDMPSYLKVSALIEGHLPVMASKGCPYHCNFCIVPTSRPYQHRSPAGVLEEIRVQESRHRRHGLKSIGFYDPSFGVQGKRYYEMMKLFQKDNLADRLTWYCATRPEAVTGRWAREAERAGCQTVQLGLESGIEGVRRGILNKQFSNSLLRQATRNLRESKIDYEFNLMIGVPGTTWWDDFRSFLFAASLRPAGINVSHYYLYHNTPLGDAHLRMKPEAHGTRSPERYNLTKVLKLCCIPYLILTGTLRYGPRYFSELFTYVFNLNERRVLPLFHPKTATLLSHRPIHYLKRDEFLTARAQRRTCLDKKGRAVEQRLQRL